MKIISLIILTFTSISLIAQESGKLSDSRMGPITSYTYVNQSKYFTQIDWKDLNEKSESGIPPNKLSFYYKQAREYASKSFPTVFEDKFNPVICDGVIFHSIGNPNNGNIKIQTSRWYVLVPLKGVVVVKELKNGKKEQQHYFIQVLMDLDGNVFPIIKAPNQSKPDQLEKPKTNSSANELKKVPEYKFKPRYLALSFDGQEQQRLWLILDGDDTLYVDCNLNGRIEPETEIFQSEVDSVTREKVFRIDRITSRDGTILARELRLIRIGAEGQSVIDVVKLLLPKDIPAVGGWKSLFKGDKAKVEPLLFSGSIRPRSLRSNTLSLSGEKKEIHLGLMTKRSKSNICTFLGLDTFPDNITPTATIIWPSKSTNFVKTQVQLTERC